jgi:uncharacterized protein (UPF0333 family)
MKSIDKDQRGLAHIAMVVLVVAVLAAVGGVGYYVMNKQKKTDTKTNASTAAASKAVNEECMKALNDSDFCKFASNWNGLESYKAVITGSGAEGNSVMTIEVENSKRSKFTMTVNGAETMASVTIDNTSYIKDLTDGKWAKYTSTTQDNDTDVKDDISINFKDDPATPEKEDATTYAKIGKEACGKLTCFKYKVTDPSTPADEQFVWFDDKDYLLRQWSNKSEGVTSLMAISYEKVSISVPSPVKESSTPTQSSVPADVQSQIDAAMESSEE